MEKFDLKDQNNLTKDNIRVNTLESSLADKYDSAAESQTSDQSDDQENVKESDLINEADLKLGNLSINGHATAVININSTNLQFRNKTSINEKINLVNSKNSLESSDVQGQGRKSNSEILIAHTKERITQKFDLLERETGLKLKKSGFEFVNSQETLSSNNEFNSSQELYANSQDSESLSSFKVKHRKISAGQVEEQSTIRIESELRKAQKDLKLRDEEIAKLSRIRREVELELEDLTASLFEEANKMVQEAKHQKSKSDKALEEATMKNDVLQAEVKALKVLVRNSIPSSVGIPNRQDSFKSTKLASSLQSNSFDLIKNQFTPKLIKSPKNSIRAMINRTSIPFHSKHIAGKTSLPKLVKSEKRSCKKSPSNYELTSDASKNLSEQNESHLISQKVKEETNQCINDLKKFGEIDPIYYEEFLKWRKCPVLHKEGEFMIRIYKEEIETTMNFKNQKLTNQVLEAIKENNITIESNNDRSSFQKKCALLDIPRVCNYRMKVNDEWHNISQLCRDRTSACCDLFCYLRYIQQGLVKSGLTEVYWEICRRRRNLILSKLGFNAL